MPRERPSPPAVTATVPVQPAPPIVRNPWTLAAFGLETNAEATPDAAIPAEGEIDIPLPRDRPEPGSPTQAASEPPEPTTVAPVTPAPETPPEPRVYQVGCPAILNGEVTGKVIPPIHDGQCGLQSPLSIEAVSANGRTIPLNAPIITDCGMASALPDWIAEVDSYVAAHDKTRIDTVNLSTSYACRNVDNAATGNLSFHAFADALDLIGFTLEDGRKISISPGWFGTPEQGSNILRFTRDAACTHFTTVLGPEADSFHQDNMHVDLACHGKTCTARLCQ